MAQKKTSAPLWGFCLLINSKQLNKLNLDLIYIEEHVLTVGLWYLLNVETQTHTLWARMDKMLQRMFLKSSSSVPMWS